MTTLTAIDPTTGRIVREVPAATPAEITEIIDRSQTAYATWKDTTLAERAEVLRRVGAYLREHTEELAPLMTEEMGKPIGEARGEVAKSAWAAEHYAEFGPRVPRRGASRLGCDLLLRAVPAAGPGAGDPALERPVLGRLPLLRPGADGREHLRS